jgi:hypothetical protein
VNNFNHIYTNIGNNLGTTQLQINEKQQLTNGTIVDFASDGFGNNMNYLLNDLYVGV